MLTYEYECEKCGLRFECRQAITDEPITTCPKCGQKVHRLVSGGTGFIFKGSGHRREGYRGSKCSMDQKGKTCCGLDEPCGKPPCGNQS